MRLFRPVVTTLALAAGFAADAETFGKQEHVQVLGGSSGIEVVATLSGGGPRTVLYAREIKYFLKDGDTWVRFTIDNGSVVTGRHLTLEKPLIKDERVRQKDGSIEHISRVQGELCIGTHRVATELHVSDRSTYTAPLVIGSEDLAPLGSIDPARSFLHEPDCAPMPTAPAGPTPHAAVEPARTILSAASTTAPAEAAYHCDGRTRCSQMHSCDEAKFFLAHCPNTQMDGDGDGIPCEDQFCGH